MHLPAAQQGSIAGGLVNQYRMPADITTNPQAKDRLRDLGPTGAPVAEGTDVRHSEEAQKLAWKAAISP